MTKKEKIEKATADAFIVLYNREMRTSFCITEYSDVPDIRCRDSEGQIFNFEITLTEDRETDIKAMLGESDHWKIKNLQKQLNEEREEADGCLDTASCLQGNVADMLISRIQKKIGKDYGSNVALVIRDTSPVCWDWELSVDDIRRMLEPQRNPYDKGIWILSFLKDCIYRII